MQLLGHSILDFLVEKKVKHVFVLTGGAISFVLDCFDKRKDIEYICVAHEQSAAMMADAYSRSGKGFASTMVTSGPGATNLITGICCSWFDSIPNIHICGQVNQFEIKENKFSTKNCRQIGFQETNIINISKEFTKKSIQLKKSKNVNETLHFLYNHATTGRPGPVLLDIPIDLQKEKLIKVETQTLKTKKILKKDLQLETKIKKLLSYLESSKRPVIIAGGGIRISKSEDLFYKFINRLNIPIVSTWSGFDLLDFNHKNYFNTIGVYGHRSSNFIVQNSDLIICLGSRLDTRITGGNPKSFAREAKMAVIDIDTNELNKKRGLNIKLKINNDINDFLKVFFNITKNKSFKFDLSNWIHKCNVWKKDFSFESERTFKTPKINAYHFIETLSDVLDQKSIIIPDDGGHLTWTMQAFKIKKGQRLFSAFGNSPMGYSLPAAIGASIANPKRTIVAIDGDGSIQINIQELVLVKNRNLNIKIFIIDNNGYGIIKQFQSLYMNKRYIASDQGLPNPDLISIAKAYKINTHVLKYNKDLKKKLKKIINLKGPQFTLVKIDKNQIIEPKLEFGKPIEEVSPELNKAVFKKNMIIKPFVNSKKNQEIN
tara:strand:- start:1855 stop:3657 length:1803 start_codon:yes stop_codon:yes gene_type:complete